MCSVGSALVIKAISHIKDNSASKRQVAIIYSNLFITCQLATIHSSGSDKGWVFNERGQYPPIFTDAGVNNKFGAVHKKPKTSIFHASSPENGQEFLTRDFVFSASRRWIVLASHIRPSQWACEKGTHFSLMWCLLKRIMIDLIV